MRPSQRSPQSLRPVEIIRQFTQHAEGSVLIRLGNTHVLCNASITAGVPPFLKGKEQGWLTAEYSMLPRATHERSSREAAKGKQTGRTQEIQRLIGRALRHAVDLTQIGERTIILDCDVLQADGSTRTASITGACIALYDALQKVQLPNAFVQWIAAVSVGLFQDEMILDLDYAEDSKAGCDLNVVQTEKKQFIEIQGTGEASPFEKNQLLELLNLAENGIQQFIHIQKNSVGM